MGDDMRASHVNYVFIYSIIYLIFTCQLNAQQADRIFGIESSPYQIKETLLVPFGEVWRIDAGVEICFEAGAQFSIDGILLAEGASDTPITFGPCERDRPWGGIRFSDSREIDGIRSRLSHVIVEGAAKGRPEFNDRTEVSPDTAGGGVYIERSDVDIVRSVVRNNAAELGGGVYIGADSDVAIQGSAIYGNTALGSRFIYTGGGGLYVSGARRARVLQSIVALNSMPARGYGNEEGGGGIYLGQGPLEVSFTLVVANVAEKASGMLVLSEAGPPSVRRFTANVFMYNRGSLNLEQVALQTRNTYDEMQGGGEWSVNAGQAPFVAHLNRNRLSSRPFLGSSRFIEALRPGGAASFATEIEDRADPAAYQDVADALRDRRICGDAFDYGPIEICGADERSMGGYLAQVGALYSEDLRAKLTTTIATAAGPQLDDADRSRLSELLAPAEPERGPGTPAPDPLDPRIVELVFGSDTQRGAAVAAFVVDRTQKRGIYSPALLLHALGLMRDYSDFLSARGIDPGLLREALAINDEGVALSLFRAAPSIGRKEQYEFLQIAAASNLTRLMEVVLDGGVKAAMAFQERYPLHVAVAEGNVEAVQLLLRYGADPNALSQHMQGKSKSLAVALEWYHLGGGRHVIAEMLVAAGAELSAGDLSGWQLSSNLLLLSAIQVGALDTETAARVAAGSTETDDFDRILRPQLIDKVARVQPVIAAIRRLRDLPADHLAATMKNPEADPFERVAASRILSVRNFDLTPAILSDLSAAAGTEIRPGFDRLPEPARILQYRRSARSSLTKGTGSPAPLSAERVRNLPFGRKLAIVIGVSDYAKLSPRSQLSGGRLADLLFAEADAHAVVELLRSGERLGSGWEVQELVGPRATLADVRRAMAVWAAEAGPDDLALFYFSGHGELGTDGRTYFLLQDSDPKDLAGSALPFADVRDWTIGLKASRALLLLDACRSGTIGSAKGNPTLIDYEELLSKRPEKQSGGKIAITSSLGEQLSYEWSERGLGFFTATLVDALEGRISNYAVDDFLTVNELLKALQDTLPKRSRTNPPGIEQIPNYVLLDGSDLLNFPLR